MAPCCGGGELGPEPHICPLCRESGGSSLRKLRGHGWGPASRRAMDIQRRGEDLQCFLVTPQVQDLVEMWGQEEVDSGVR